MTGPFKERGGFIVAADPDWLDTLQASRYDRPVYYKNPYNAPKLPVGSWLLCYRAHEDSPCLNLSGIVTASDVLSFEEAWSRYGLLLGVGHSAQTLAEWIAVARSVLRPHVKSVFCIQLESPRWYKPPIPLSRMGLTVSSGTGQSGEILSHADIGRFEGVLLSAPPILPSKREETGASVGVPQGSEGRILLEDLDLIRKDRVDSTTKEALVNARIGQGKFRADVLQLWENRCCVTGSVTRKAIRASHIQPWRESTNEERLDSSNGLPLVASLDTLFDAGLISFDSSGRLLVSSRMTPTERQIFGIDGRSLTKKPSAKTAGYLAYHRRKHWFEVEAELTVYSGK